ncbi:N-acetyltransferase [Rhizobium sp. RM]|uniref:GNAT family N-acetyltransferase n=1 Tax=Rhizobium sp. RM TaxID=2748079 RepID=UPI00110D5EC3|nr:N-acetyltransferase [Rhizobium sp. RM]NWJ26416.1 N-acetyltransferase [Rhizobium sp. RM]TMV18037.1 N-acetyltransferase [Rhizobium sp. Td3]
MIVRPERSGDEADISRVTEAAFRNMAFSDQTEHLIVGRLRQAGALAVSLVAEHGDEIIGHIGFSPVTLSSGEAGWFALGPLSVLPENQGQGVGAALVRAGLSALDGMGASGCVLAGNPAYYGRFGFANVAGLTSDGIPDEYLMALTLHGGTPSGIVGFHQGFYGDAV